MNAGLIAIAAVRANGASRPQKRLDMRIGGGFVLKMGGVEYGSHENLLDGRSLWIYLWFVK
jgi:hypothetical protein